MYLYNSATHKKEEFKTHTPGHVEMYTCGPTVAEYAEAEDAEQLTRLARNIGCFTFIEGATSYAEVGRFFTETEDRYILDLEMEDYFDYEGFGEYISDKFYGKFVCGGFLRRAALSMNIYY